MAQFLLFTEYILEVISEDSSSNQQWLFFLVKHTFIATKQIAENTVYQVFLEK